MSRKPSRLEKSTAIMKDAKASQWCYVNTLNEFEFMNQTFVIDESVDEYRVHNRAFEVLDFTNEAYMEEILVVIDSNSKVRFYNQNYDEIETWLVEVVE
jgi:hypothetical protein